MALSITLPLKDPDTVVNGSTVVGKDSGVTVSHLRVRFVGISFKRNGTGDGAQCSVEGFVGNTAEKAIYFDNVPIVLSAAQYATVLAAVQNKLNNHPKYTAATPIADPA